MLMPTPGSNVSMMQREYTSHISIIAVFLSRCRRALIFFGTPHGGGNDALVNLGKVSARILDLVTGSAPNDIMQAVKKGSMYSDILREGFRHQLLRYSIVSFIEGRGKVLYTFMLKWLFIAVVND